MSIIYVLIPIAMLFVLIAVSIFFWAVKSEQFDDLDRQSVSILFDDDNINPNNTANTNGIDDRTSPSHSSIKCSTIKTSVEIPNSLIKPE
ncbi:cbb3-type cytochrome oxidase assembly protein CcoS [Shewanella livingstonensis]|uniref:cbb3-type cytochrome oxidase assembly protein CcoS n=1 Tax=Shewanella livingstonensis TaxID=150120 RepID=UPI001FC96A6F|nr:cbb3-type cytochrome oxidase assembly protein CcoS [Shewanella livingstonensis]